MSQFEVVSAVHGIAPRSDELHQLGTNFEKGRVGLDEFIALRDQEAQNWLKLQAELGIDLPGDSKLEWQDHLRPIVKASRGFAPDIDDAPVTRWFETNTFYRRPTITGPLRFDVQAFQENVAPLGETVSLLGIKDFSELCANQYEGLAARKNVTNLYRQIAYGLGNLGVKRIIFERHTDPGDNRAYSGETSIAFDSPSPKIVQLPTERPSVFVGRYGSALSQPYRQERWLPIIETETTVTDEGLSDNEIDYLRHNDLSRLVLTNTVDFKFLPLPYAQAKLRRLAEITKETREKLGGES